VCGVISNLNYLLLAKEDKEEDKEGKERKKYLGMWFSPNFDVNHV
jgi:hypothetical protein